MINKLLKVKTERFHVRSKPMKSGLTSIARLVLVVPLVPPCREWMQCAGKERMQFIFFITSVLGAEKKRLFVFLK